MTIQSPSNPCFLVWYRRISAFDDRPASVEHVPVPAFLGQVLRRDDTFRRLARFFRADADPWERLEIQLPPQTFGLASQRQFHAYLDGHGPESSGARDLRQVCEFLRRCRAMDDLTLFQATDHWQHPSTFEHLRQGDCEDHALWAWRELHRLRHPALFVAGLWRGTAHAWILTRIDRREHVLETMEKKGPMLIPVETARPDYVPALAVGHDLRTYAYQGYQRLHQARAGRNPATPTLAVANVRASEPSVEIVILAGGLSSRFGRDKSRARWQGRTLLSRIRETAWSLGHPVRVLRKDAVARCGPLGGVITALRGSRADLVLFLACDMPGITPDLLLGLRGALGPRTSGVFATDSGRLGFPFLLRTSRREDVERLWASGSRSLVALADALRARRWKVPARWREQLFNINTPSDLDALRGAERGSARPRSRLLPSA